MVYVFEGARNSGKTYLSEAVSAQIDIPRFQFDFVGGFNLLGLENSNNREAHSFAMGKELMLMQIARDLKDAPDFIHDRGILTVLTWGLLENRITEKDVDKQIEYLKEKKLFSNITIIYIEGENPVKTDRNKDQWDYADKSNKERDCFELVVKKLESAGVKVVHIENTFTFSTAIDLGILIKLFQLG